MMDFSLKLAWFILSLSGLLFCTLFLTAFSRATGMKWGPVLYCVGNLLLQGSFCLGMIWKMDPYLMPKSFCVAQTVFISLGGFIVGGVTMAFSVATYLTSMKPKTWGDSFIQLMQWKPIYWAFILAFPVCASVAHLIVILEFDSVQPSDDMHCDSTSPEWVRFVGYAGIPFIIAGPSLYLSLQSVLRIRKTNLHIQRARPESAAAQALNKILPCALRGTFFCKKSSTKREAGAIPTIVRPVSAAQASIQYNVPPFAPSSTSTNGLSSNNLSPPTAPSSHYGPTDTDHDFDDTNSRLSFTFPMFSDPENSNYVRTAERKSAPVCKSKSEEVADSRESGSDNLNYHDPWNEDKLELKSMSESVPETVTGDRYDGPQASKVSIGKAKTRRPIPILKPAVWQIILFQIAFMCIQILACVSTIIDIATKRATPTPMGTQHVALLLASWGPVIVFGHLPMVRRNLLFWRPVDI